MQINNVELRVLIKGKSIQEYRHNGSTFVEGREGSIFELHLTNRNPYRVEAIVSVDGLSVIDGQTAGVHSSGYLLEANESLVVPGWKLNDQAVAQFVFSGKGDSYSTAMTGSDRNNGVIGLMAFAERNYRHHLPQIARAIPAFPNNNGIIHTTVWNQATIGSGLDADLLDGMTGTSYMSGTAGGYVAPTTSSLRSRKTIPTTLSNTRPAPGGGSNAYGSVASTSDVLVGAQLNQVCNLGTGFGQTEEFQTQLSSFSRGDMIGMLVLYYDNARGLRARGIQVGRTSRVKHTAQTPQAFPGMNCAPPPGWRP